MRQPIQKVNSIDKALSILSCFVPYNQEMGTVEIGQRLGFHKATVSRSAISQGPSRSLLRIDKSQLNEARARLCDASGHNSVASVSRRWLAPVTAR